MIKEAITKYGCVYSFKASRHIFYANSLEKTEYIIRFYKGIIKEKPNTVENALLNVSLGGYYY